MKVGVIGCGVMGIGIAQLSVQAGYTTLIYNRSGKAAAAVVKLCQTFDTLVAKGKLDADLAERAKGRLRPIEVFGELSECDIVIESITEDFDAKVALFVELENIVQHSAIIASNTSSLSITELSAKLKYPGRFAGFHFFNPAPLMKVIETVRGSLTQETTVTKLHELGVRFGHSVVVAEDTPGFIVNHAGRAYLTEALRIESEGIAPFYEIDRVLKDQAGFKMGPFELLDLMGLNTSYPVLESIYNQFYQDPRYKPTPLVRKHYKANLLGKRTGKGFYTYIDGKQQGFPEQETVQADVVPCGTTVALLGTDVTTAAVKHLMGDPRYLIGIDTLFLGAKRAVLMASPAVVPAALRQAQTEARETGLPVSIIKDSPGFISQRVVAMIVNLGCEIAQQGIASPADIDTAVKLALGYPFGPLEWGDRLGADKVLIILNELYTFYHDPRYRPSAWLTRRAMLGMSLRERGW